MKWMLNEKDVAKIIAGYTFLYWVVLTIEGATIGKYIMRIKVTDEYGVAIDMWPAIFRFLIQNFGIIFFIIGGLMKWDDTLIIAFFVIYILMILSQFLNSKRRAIYDFAVNSIVIKK
jgi:uncharacterized RDD family membrane protein YckC